MEKVAIGTGRRKKTYVVLGVDYNGSLNPTAAQNVAAYTVYSGKVEKNHKVSQVVYNKPMPLSRAIYFPSRTSKALSVPRGHRKLANLEKLEVNVSLVTDPQGRPINNGQNFTATVTNTGVVAAP